MIFNTARKPVFFIPNQNYYSRIISVFDMMGKGEAIKIVNNIFCAAKNKVFFIPYVLHLEHPNLVVDDEFIKAARQLDNAYIILDYSEEAIPLHGAISQKFIELHKLLEEHKFDPKKTFIAAAGHLMEEEYNQWCLDNKINFKLNIIGFNPLLFRNIYWLLSNEWFKEATKKIIKFSENKTELRDKKYMCLNLRPRSHRATLVSHLLAKSYLDEGIVTYFGEEFGNQDSISVAAANETQKFINEVDPSGALLESFQKLQTLSPLRFDRDSSEMRNNAYSNENLRKWHHLIPELTDETNIKTSTYFEIVTETWFEEGNVFVSEKTMRAITRMQFFIIVGSPYTLRYLKELGFKTFSPFIDESYDEIADPVERMKRILTEIDKILNLSKEEIRDFYYKVYDVIKFNYLFLLKRMPEAFEQGIEKKFLSKILAISSNSDQVKFWKCLEQFKKCLSIRRNLKSRGGIQNSKKYRFNSSKAQHLFKNLDII